jgi:hypothetical protein
MEQTIIDRAVSDPKPMYYREAFLNEKLEQFMRLHNYNHTDQIPPDDFVRWVFPQLFKSRLPRYQAIADQYGYTVDAGEVAKISNEDDFVQLLAQTIAQQS